MDNPDTTSDRRNPQDPPGHEGVDRRTFLKGAAVAGATVAAAAGAIGAVAQDTGPKADAKRGDKARDKDASTAKSDRVPGDITIPRPGSDFMVDVIKTLDIDFVAANPASAFRSLHESLVNYGGNRKPELITCMHEETSVGIAHGYAKAAGKPMMAMVHGTVGLQHASMGIYNAWCDRVPVIIIAGNGADASKRRAGTEWYHSVQDAAAIVRDFVKWDDTPASLQHFAESMVRAYRVATTAPMEPVLITADIDLQEEAVHEQNLRIPKLTRRIQAAGDYAALEEAAKLLAGAQNPVIIADRAVRSQSGVDRIVQLAEALGAAVVNLGGRMNFPSHHPLCHTERRRALVRDADVVLLLEVGDRWAQFNQISDPHKVERFVGRKEATTISLGMSDAYIRSNYQDFQRFMPIDLAIVGDPETSLPVLIGYVNQAMTPERRRGADARAAQLADEQRKELARAREEAAAHWNLSPISTARLAMELYGAIKDSPWSLAVSDRIPWAPRLWPTTQYQQMLGASGGVGVGYGVAGAVGVALANKAKGLLTVTFQPDGDLMYAPGALWTAAHHRIPVLFLMHNNRAYHQEIMHLQRMAALHDRRPDQAWIGNIIDRPAIDFAKLAQSMGVWAEGPISDPDRLGPAIRRAVEIVKRGEPALVDAVCQPR
jgi:acetolactate synthase I/II/III large subunit